MKGTDLLVALTRFLTTLIWPVFIISLVLLLKSVRFEPQLTLAYITVLRWPIVAILGISYLAPFLPRLINRLRKFGAGPVSGEFAPPSQQAGGSDALSKDESSSEPASKESDEEDELEKVLTSPEVKVEYERIYSSIFGSQLSLLKRLSENIPTGLRQEQLEDIYYAHTSSTNESYPSFIHFVQYLIDNSLALFDAQDSHYKLTNAGLYFLRYLIETSRYNSFKPL